MGWSSDSPLAKRSPTILTIPAAKKAKASTTRQKMEKSQYHRFCLTLRKCSSNVDTAFKSLVFTKIRCGRDKYSRLKAVNVAKFALCCSCLPVLRKKCNLKNENQATICEQLLNLVS
jgi:hypothetical protein